MSALNYIRPIPSIDGIVRDVWAKCKDGYFDHVHARNIEGDMDVRYLIDVIQEVTRVTVSYPSMTEVNVREPYEIETPQFVFCIQPYDEGGAVWTDGARRIEIGHYTVLYCERGDLEAVGKRGGHYLCLWEDK